MNKILTAIFSVSLFLVACNNNNKTESDPKKEYEKTKETLADKEKKNPELFLRVSGTDKHNILGQTVVKGKITNNAVATTYKDVEIKLDFYSKTGTKLETDKETIFEIIPPGETKTFKTKYFAPKGSDSVGLAVISAHIDSK